MNLGKKITNLRKKEKITQEKFAELIGVTRQTISNWESNITKPDINQIKEISKIFNISIDELLDNNIRDIIEKKISKTEELTNKSTKNIKIIIITMYFIILISAIIFVIYILTNKDFTKKYQAEFYCTSKDKTNYIVSVTSEYNEEIKKDDYFIEVAEQDKKTTGYGVIEKLYVGTTLSEIFDGLEIIKKVMINDYNAKCR